MKKQIIIVLLLPISMFAWSQNFIKTTTPCNEALLMKTPGRWIKVNDLLYATEISKQQQQEILNRLEAVHQFVLKIYPSPLGVDAVWHRFTADGTFASQVKIDFTRDGVLRENEVNGNSVVNYSYVAAFFSYGCGREPYEMMTGWPGETGSDIKVYANSMHNFFVSFQLDKTLVPIMCIDGRLIKMMPAIKRKWKGYTVYYPETGSAENYILLHREGILPYIPVTRKQYLERCIDYIPKFFDPMIKGYESFPEKEQRDEYLKNIRQQKENVLKLYQEELEHTTAAKLLDSPALIPTYIFNITGPVFIREEDGGKMLVTENPAYIRKDLSKYVPQFFVMTWVLCNNNWKPIQNVCKAVEENFPIEKLQAMIDK